MTEEIDHGIVKKYRIYVIENASGLWRAEIWDGKSRIYNPGILDLGAKENCRAQAVAFLMWRERAPDYEMVERPFKY